MYFWQAVLLVIAGVFGGMANAMAGGASLFTFPAMMSTGLPPIVANASNGFSLLPANSLGAFIDREKLPRRGSAFYATTFAALGGGLLGGILLVITPPRFFSMVVPALIGLATGLFIFGKAAQRGLAKLLDGDDHPRLRAFLIFIGGIYAGYFGAGVGVVFLAVLGATSQWELRTTNAMKNILGFAGNLSANLFFVWQGVISWPETLTMMAGATVGAFAGGYLIKVLPSQLVRNVISISGVIMTAIYVYRFWL